MEDLFLGKRGRVIVDKLLELSHDTDCKLPWG
jgi:hypothetical protein